MLLGQYEAKISDKHQVAFPKKFRETLGDRLIVTKGFESCLIVVSEKNWRTLLEGTEGKPFTGKATRELQRFLLGNASFVELDMKGRFVLPEHLRVYGKLTENIIFAGLERFVEIWNKEMWEEQQTMLAENLESITQRLSKEGVGDE